MEKYVEWQNLEEMGMWKRFLVAFLLATIAVVPCLPVQGVPVFIPAPPPDDHGQNAWPVYDIQACYDPGSGLIRGDLLLAGQGQLTQFNIPANAPYGAGAHLTVQGVWCDGQPVPWDLQGDCLQVTSEETQYTKILHISFQTQVPQKANRLGCTGETSVLAGWYPLLSPAGARVAEVPYGEPYFAEAAIYRVQLTVPCGYQVVAGSSLTGVGHDGDTRTWHFHSQHPIREFACVVSKDWQVTETRAGHVRLRAYADQARTASLATAKKALSFFQTIYGSYPYEYLHLVWVPLGDLAGMEYPGLILLNSTRVTDPQVVVHEVAHQWWYNLVGSDSCREAWIDEGLAEYSTRLFFGGHALAGAGPAPINLSLEEYKNRAAYRLVVYRSGLAFWCQAEQACGRQGLQDVLRALQERYRFQIGRGEEVLEYLRQYGLPAEVEMKFFPVSEEEADLR